MNPTVYNIFICLFVYVCICLLIFWVVVTKSTPLPLQFLETCMCFFFLFLILDFLIHTPTVMISFHLFNFRIYFSKILVCHVNEGYSHVLYSFVCLFQILISFMTDAPVVTFLLKCLCLFVVSMQDTPFLLLFKWLFVCWGLLFWCKILPLF